MAIPHDMSPLVVTHIVQDQPLIKVYATSDVHGIVSLDRILNATTIGQDSLVSSPSDVMVGNIVLVPRFHKYRRAEVVGSEGQTIAVNFKDIGGTARCNIYDIRVIRSPDLKGQLLSKPFVRTNEYILYNSVTSREWNAKELETVNALSNLAQDRLKLQVLSLINNKPLIRVSFKTGHEDFMCFASWMKDYGLASVVGPEMIQSTIQSKYPSQSRMPFTSTVPPGFPPMDVQPQHIAPPTSTLPYSFPTPQPIQPILPTAVPNGYPYSIRPSMSMSMPLPTTRIRAPRPQFVQTVPQAVEPLKEQKPLTLTAETLPVGSMHDIYISYVIDGAQNFTVQLKSKVETILGQLMMALDEQIVEPYTDPLQPGTVCVGRFMKEKAALCRAIVSSVLTDGASLYFVDFGNSDIVPFNEIYKMRPEFTREKMVAMRFSLADVNTDYLQTQEAEKVFKQLTMESNHPIRMEVVKPETPLKQFCKLYVEIDGKWVNVRDKMQAMMKVLQPVEYKTLPFKKGSQADVMVSYTESPARFFVQLSLNAPQLFTIMSAVKQYCATAKDKEILFPEDLSVDVPVCAMFVDDQQWYRAQVITEPDVAGNVEVLFVDYGNSEIVHYTQLRAMNGEMISLAPMQAVECRLDFSAELSVRDDVIEYFSTLVLETEFAMRVENVLPAKMLLVDLVEKAKNVAVKDDLLKRFSPPAQETVSRMNSKPITPQQNNAGNWRDRNNSAGSEGNFSAFSTNNRTNSYGAIDEPDNVRTDISEKRDRFASRDGGEQSGTWKVPRREETTTPSWNDTSNRFSEHDDRTSRNDGDSGGYRGSDSGFRSRGRDNDRPFNRDGGDRSWKSDRNGDDRGRRNDSWNTSSSKPSGGDSWDADKKDDDWSSGGNRRGGDRDFKSSYDRGSDRKPYQKRDDYNRSSSNDDWNAEKKDDNWSSGGGGGNRRDFKSNDSWNKDDNRGGGGFRDSKPRNDRDGGGYREKRDFGGSGGGGSSWKNDSSSGGGWKNDTSADSSWDTPTTPSREPAYERGAVFVEPSYQPGETLEVAVSWFVNPMQFYAIPVGNSDYNALMETVQTDYARREFIDVESLKPNECVVARDTDDVIYRARFVRSIRSKKALVTFVDFGNNASVGEAWAVSQEHCAIPTQAIFCRLHGITKADENSPWSAMPDLETHFQDDKYTLTFVESVEENGSTVWSINLKNSSDVDIGDLLVSSGFAVRQNVLKSEELYDLTLLKDQTIQVYPGSVDSSKKFFVHIEPHQAQLIQRLIQELTESQKMLPLPLENMVVGEFCLAPCDEEYFRALILSVDETAQNAHILFVDYGDENDAAFSSMKILPDYLSIYNSQIAECCLYEEDGPKEEMKINEIAEQDLIMKVVDVIDNKLHVLLYDVQGVRFPFPTAVEETISPLCKLPVLRFNDSVSITHIENDKVYLQRVSDGEHITKLGNQLFDFYEKLAAEKVALEADKVYVAKSAKFETWYRCKPVNEECKDVFYIDYGNTESAEEVLSIQPLDAQFYALPMFCVGVSTNVHFTVEDLTPFIDNLQNFTFSATFKPVAPNEYYADLKCDSTSRTLADLAVEAACGEALPSTEEKTSPHTAFEPWNMGEEKKVRVSHMESPDAFHLQTVEDQPTITRLQDQLQTLLTRVLPLLGPHDDLMAAQNPADKKWYRARPTSKEDVFAVDFGFTLKTPRLKKLPTPFKLDESSYTVACSLNLQPVEGAWNAEIVARLTDSVTKAENVTAKLEFVKHRVKFVDMKVDSTDVSEVISGLGVSTCPKSNEVIVSHANALDDFYLQYCEDEDELYALVELMKEADAWDVVAEPEADRMYAAQFVEDEQWYRAVVVKSEEDGSKQVRFVDYGNVGLSTLFKALPENLLTLPPYAVQCTQHPMPENAEELNEIFAQFASTVEGYFNAFVVSGGAPLMVMLEFKDRLINDILIERKALLEWKLQPAEVGDKVVVSHINSPSSFYVRGETATFDAVEQALATCESAEPLAEYAVDYIVAAKFPEDGLWYRAKVLEVTEAKTNVLFVDYGNQSEVEDVRTLPDDAKLVACIAKHCSIRVPEGLDEWPSVASERFSELTCEGETVFQMSIKEDGDPAIVDLHDDGLSVADELATLCKAELTAPTPQAAKEQVILSHVSGVDAVWIQYQSPQLDEMCEELANVEAFDELDMTKADVGMLVAAEFEEMWYRATIVNGLKGGEEKCKVLFIDYGNEGEVTLLKRLPEDLANLAPLAKCCRLKGRPVSTVEDGDASVLETLQQFVDEMKTFYVEELDESSGEPIVSLRCCDDDKTLAEIVFGSDGSAENAAPNVDGDAAAAAAEVVEPSAVDENVIVAENAQVEESAPCVNDGTAEVAEQVMDTETEESESCVDDSVPEAAELSTDTHTEQNDVEETPEPSPSGDENIEPLSEALDGLSIASPNSDETKESDTLLKPSSEDIIGFDDNAQDLDDPDLTAVDDCKDDSSEDSPLVENSSNCDDKVEENIGNENQLDEQAEPIVDAEEPADDGAVTIIENEDVVEEESNETIRVATTPEKNVEDVAVVDEETPAVEDTTSSTNEKLPTNDDDLVESAGSPVPNEHDRASLEDEGDQFRTPSCKSSIEEFATPDQMLDVSSASEELNTSFSVEYVLDLPEYVELFESAATDEFDKCDCRVSYVTDVHDFYVQRIPVDTKRIDLMERILEACVANGVLSKLESPQVGDLVAAKLDDGVWYRLKIVSASDPSATYDAVCVDHGKPCSTSEVFALPEQLSALPTFAHQCTLLMSKVPASTDQTFKELVSDCSTTYKIKLLMKDEHTTTIDLRDGSTSVTKKLMEKFLSE